MESNTATPTLTVIEGGNPQGKEVKTHVFDFTDKASYLAYRADWRSRYAEAATELKRLKGVIASKQKDGGYAGSEMASLMTLKIHATDMLVERRASKVEAGQQWRTQREVRQAAERFTAGIAAQ
jgi:uncharacterized protein with FMN-binding domain